VKAGVLERYVGLAAQRVGVGGSILILLDANGDCPARLGPALVARARSRPSHPTILAATGLKSNRPCILHKNAVSYLYHAAPQGTDA